MLKPFEEQEKLRSHRTKKSNPKHLHCFKEKVAAHPNNVLHTRRIADGTNKIYPLPPMLTHSALSTLRTSRIDAQSYRIEQKKKKKNHHYKLPYRVVIRARTTHHSSGECTESCGVPYRSSPASAMRPSFCAAGGGASAA